MKPISFSIILPLYNKEQSIEKTILSVLNQTYSSFELIVVNDGSTDRSAEIVSNLKSNKISLINKPNGGVSSARNEGIKKAKFDYIGFIDGDDLWEPTYLEEMAKLIIDFPEQFLYGCAFDRINNGKRLTNNNNIQKNFRGIIKNSFPGHNGNWLFWPTTSIINKKSLLTVGLFDERICIGEDIDMWIRFLVNGAAVYYNKTLAHYNLDGPNRAMTKKQEFTKTIFCYTDKYKDWERRDTEFKKYINFYRISNLEKIYKELNATKDEKKKYLSLIDAEGQIFKFRVIFSLPTFVQNWIINLRYSFKFL